MPRNSSPPIERKTHHCGLPPRPNELQHRHYFHAIDKNVADLVFLHGDPQEKFGLDGKRRQNLPTSPAWRQYYRPNQNLTPHEVLFDPSQNQKKINHIQKTGISTKPAALPIENRQYNTIGKMALPDRRMSAHL